jgi:hypothetical protein
MSTTLTQGGLTLAVAVEMASATWRVASWAGGASKVRGRRA